MGAFSDAQAQRWQRKRERGKRRYVFVTGVLGWGGVMAAIFIAKAYSENRQTFPVMLAVSLVVWPLGGLAFGLLTWKSSERKFQEWEAARAANTK